MHKIHNIEYSDGETTLKGHYVYDETKKGKRPGILIAPDFYGIGDFTINKAQKIADLGYVGFAIDMYGDGKHADDKEEAVALLTKATSDRAQLLRKIQAAFTTLKKIDVVDSTKTASMGFCFGGLCSLDLARSGADVKGVVSFHGKLIPPNLPKHTITAKVLVLHGYKDALIPHEDILKFAAEMDEAKANWEMDIYGEAMHSFTKPTANDLASSMVYNKQADARSWLAMKNFFEEIF